MRINRTLWIAVAVVALLLSACKNRKGQQVVELSDGPKTEVSDTLEANDEEEDYDESSTSSATISADDLIGQWKTKSSVLGCEGSRITVAFEEEDVTLKINISKSVGGVGSGSTVVTVPGTYTINSNNGIEWEFYPDEIEMGKLSASFTEDAKDEIFFTPGTESKYRSRLSGKVMEEARQIVKTCNALSPLPLKKTTAKKLIFEGADKDYIFTRIEEEVKD